MQNGSGDRGPLLLDTHYWLWLEAGDKARLAAPNLDIIRKAANSGELFVSAISVWEIAMLASKGRVDLYEGCTKWVEEALTRPGLTLAPLSPAVAIESTRLPGSFHSDPADRIIVATARIMGARLLTSDKDIRAYARQHHLLLAS